MYDYLSARAVVKKRQLLHWQRWRRVTIRRRAATRLWKNIATESTKSGARASSKDRVYGSCKRALSLSFSLSLSPVFKILRRRWIFFQAAGPAQISPDLSFASLSEAFKRPGRGCTRDRRNAATDTLRERTDRENYRKTFESAGSGHRGKGNERVRQRLRKETRKKKKKKKKKERNTRKRGMHSREESWADRAARRKLVSSSRKRERDSIDWRTTGYTRDLISRKQMLPDRENGARWAIERR